MPNVSNPMKMSAARFDYQNVIRRVLFRICPAATNDAEFICGWKGFQCRRDNDVGRRQAKNLPLISLQLLPTRTLCECKTPRVWALHLLFHAAPFVLQIKMMSRRDRSLLITPPTNHIYAHHTFKHDICWLSLLLDFWRKTVYGRHH
jgi:hypothetical protein